MRKREFLDYLADMQEAVVSVLEFTQGMTWDQFVQDRKTVYAVVRAFEIIGDSMLPTPSGSVNRWQA